MKKNQILFARVCALMLAMSSIVSGFSIQAMAWDAGSTANLGVYAQDQKADGLKAAQSNVLDKLYKAPNTIRVATFNIDAKRRPDLPAMAKLVDKCGVDILGLQEVDVFTTRNNRNMLKDFASAGNLKNYYFQRAIDMPDGVGKYGIGIVSKLDFINKKGGDLPRAEGIEDRAYSRVEIAVGDEVIAFYSTHLAWETTELRQQQMRELKRVVDKDPIEHKVIVGDFNCDQDHTEWATLLDRFDMANGKEGVWFSTFNGADHTIKKVREVDNIMTTRNIKVTNVGMQETELTDHNLFYADIELLDRVQTSMQSVDLQVELAKNYTPENYTKESFAVLSDALNAAKALTDSQPQSVVNKAAQDIIDAVNNLQGYPGDNSETITKFDDVKADNWYYRGVGFAAQRGLMESDGNKLFNPTKAETREAIVVMLYKVLRSNSGSKPVDLEKDAIRWAISGGITDGSDLGNVVTREQLVTLIWRFVGSPIAKDKGNLSRFKDADAISVWAEDAMSWACQTGVITGKNNSSCDPISNANRAEVATIFMRFLCNVHIKIN